MMKKRFGLAVVSVLVSVPTPSIADVAACAESYRKLAAIRTDVGGMAILEINGGRSNLTPADERTLRQVGQLPRDCREVAEKLGRVEQFLSAIANAIDGYRTDLAGTVLHIVKGRPGTLSAEQLGGVNRYIVDNGRDPRKRLPDAAHVSLMATLSKAAVRTP